jgi:galactokinase
MVDLHALVGSFQELYGREPRLFAAPGRVNLIGEHTDYNDGFVLPVAIDRSTVVAAAARDDRELHVRSLAESSSRELDLDAVAHKHPGDWINYVEGTARVLESYGNTLRGADMLIASDVPVGAGLSSSAALEIASGLALLALAGIAIDRIALARAGQKAEHLYVGTKVGIMDQLASTMGRRGEALLIDCRSLEITPVPVDTSSVALVVCNTNVEHSLASSEYNRRREECEEGVKILRTALPEITALRDVSSAELANLEAMLPEPVRRRCRHVVTENERTLEAVEALRAGSFEQMGALMAASHRSLRDDYEVSCRELDAMVEIAGGIDGVIGARMTGGGFGGCTINLVERNAVERFRDVVLREYREMTGIEGEVYVVEIGSGGEEISSLKYEG